MENAEKPLISVVTVCFNAASSIEKTILSVIHQNYSEMEYIIVDGMSTDGTYETLKRYADKVQLIHEEDAGIYDAMNKGVLAAKGEYIYFLNSGDVFKSTDTVAAIVDALGSCRPDIICGNVNYIYKERQTVRRYYRHHRLNLFCMAAGWSTCHQAVLCKTQLVREKLFDTSYMIWADQEMFAYLLKRKCSIRYIDVIICDFDAYGFSYGHANLEISRKECDRINGKYNKLWKCVFDIPKWIVRKIVK